MKRLALTLIFAVSLTACTTTTTMPVVNETGPISIYSQNSFSETETKLRQALSDRQLKLFDVIDHGQGAQSVGMDIGQSKLFVFGNPKSGTPLMQQNRLFAFELPMKILISEDAEGQISVTWTDIGSRARDYNISKPELVGKITSTLRTIVSETTA